jgi:hypothetical protein
VTTSWHAVGAEPANKKWWRNPVATWFVAFALFAVTYNVFGLGWIDAYQLAHSGKTAVATVTKLEPQNHDGCQYAYTVADHTYARSEETCGTGHQLGDRFAIVYLPATPSVATMSSPGTALRGQILFNLLVPTLAAGVVVVAGRRRRTSKPGRR